MASNLKCVCILILLFNDGIVDKSTTECRICQTHSKYTTGSTYLYQKHGMETSRGDNHGCQV